MRRALVAAVMLCASPAAAQTADPLMTSIANDLTAQTVAQQHAAQSMQATAAKVAQEKKAQAATSAYWKAWVAGDIAKAGGGK